MFWLLCFVSSNVRNTKLKTSLHKTQCPNGDKHGDKLKEKVVNKNRTIVQVYSHRHFYRFLFMSPLRLLTTQDTKHKSLNTKLESQKFETQNSGHPYTKHNVPYRLPYYVYLDIILLKSQIYKIDIYIFYLIAYCIIRF